VLNAHNVKNFNFPEKDKKKKGKFQKVIIIYTVTLSVEMSKRLPCI
jgi:hypothetical protein